MRSKKMFVPRKYTDKEKESERQHSRMVTVPVVAKVESNPWLEMLTEIGIDIDPEEWAEVTGETKEKEVLQTETILPTLPRGWSREGVPYFSTTQLSWARPEDYGWDEYEVIEGPAHFALSWAEQCSLPKRRPTHRYNRFDRFRLILNQLMLAQAADVPDSVLAKIPLLNRNGDLWEELRGILKQLSLRKYYNRIPAILCKLGYCKYTLNRNDKHAYDNILEDFSVLSKMFASSKTQLKRIYFPNLRYICVKLMAIHKVEIPLRIPYARTVKKEVSLEETFSQMYTDFIHHK